MINLNKHRIDFGKGDVGIGVIGNTTDSAQLAFYNQSARPIHILKNPDQNPGFEPITKWINNVLIILACFESSSEYRCYYNSAPKGEQTVKREYLFLFATFCHNKLNKRDIVKKVKYSTFLTV